MFKYFDFFAANVAATAGWLGIPVSHRSLAAELHAPISGSYFPDDAGCAEPEFIDGMRARESCLARVVGGISGRF